MTATDELRRMLDERGVEYASSASGRSVYIGPNTTAFANYSEDTLDISMRNLTPQQAIEVTLGRGTCEFENSWHGSTEVVEYRCLACDEFICVEVVKPDGAQPPNYCPNCGRRVVVGDGE